MPEQIIIILSMGRTEMVETKSPIQKRLAICQRLMTYNPFHPLSSLFRTDIYGYISRVSSGLSSTSTSATQNKVTHGLILDLLYLTTTLF
jgi:hypothetical protein